MRLLTSQRANLQAVSQEQGIRGDVTSSPTNWAPWKSKPALMGAVVQQDGRSRGYHPLGLSYGCCWVGPLGAAIQYTGAIRMARPSATIFTSAMYRSLAATTWSPILCSAACNEAISSRCRQFSLPNSTTHSRHHPESLCGQFIRCGTVISSFHSRAGKVRAATYPQPTGTPSP